MNKTQMIYTVLGWLVVVLLSYIVIMQPKVKAGNEILEIQQRLSEIDTQVQEEKNNWDIAEAAKQECIESWNEQQLRANEKATWLREEKKSLEERLGLLMQR